MLHALSQEDAPPRTLVLMTGQLVPPGSPGSAPRADDPGSPARLVRLQSSEEQEASRRAADQLDFVRESLLLCERSSGPKLSDFRLGEMGTPSHILGTFAYQPGPDSGPDCLIYAELAR